MKRQEWRAHEEYKKAWAKIEGYPKGFKWTMERKTGLYRRCEYGKGY